MANKELSSQITDRIVTVDQLLNAHEISLEYWEIEKQIVNSWEVGAKTPDGVIATTPLFQVKIWLKSKIESKRLDEIKAEFIEDLQALSPVVKKIEYKNVSDKPKKMVEINIFDLHLGKFAWREETNQDYDLKIAMGIFPTGPGFVLVRRALITKKNASSIKVKQIIGSITSLKSFILPKRIP